MPFDGQRGSNPRHTNETTYDTCVQYIATNRPTLWRYTETHNKAFIYLVLPSPFGNIFIAMAIIFSKSFITVVIDNANMAVCLCSPPAQLELFLKKSFKCSVGNGYRRKFLFNACAKHSTAQFGCVASEVLSAERLFVLNTISGF